MADDFDLGLTIRADGSAAVSEADKFAGSLDRVATASKKADTAARSQASGTDAATRSEKSATDATKQHADSLDRLAGELNQAKAATSGNVSASAALTAAQARQTAASAALAAAHDKVAAAADKDGAAQTRAAAQLASAQARVAAATAALERVQQKSNTAANDNAAAMNRQAFGARSLGQQVGDFFTQISLGSSPVQAFSAQVGQAGFAASEMGGRIGKVGAFLVGPWGIALTVGALVLAPFVEKLGKAAFGATDLTDALDKAAFSSSAFGNAQSILGSVIDLNTGKIKNQSTALLGLARAQAIAGQIQSRARELEARTALGKGRNDFGGSLSQAFGAGERRPGAAETNRSNSAKIINATLDGRITTDSAIKRFDVLRKKGELTEQQFIDVATTISNLGVEVENGGYFKSLEKALNGDTKAIKGFLNEAKKVKPKKPPKPKSTEARDEFGRDAANTINSIRAQYDDTPSLLREVNNQVAKLDDLIDDLARKKPPGFEKLIADAREAQGAVREGLNRPYRDFVAEQERALANSRLLAAGRVDEAEAARIVYGLERQMGPLTPARKDAVLATVQALRAESRELDLIHEKQQRQLDAISGIRGAVRGVLSDGLEGLADLPKRLISEFKTLRTDEIFEDLFGGAFRELEDQVKGTTIVEDASTRMAEAVEGTVNPLGRLADVADKAAGALGAVPTGPQVVPPSGAGIAASMAKGDIKGAVAAIVGAQVVGNPAAAPNAAPSGAANDNGGIVVNGRRSLRSQEIFAGAAEKLAKGVGISPDAAKTFGINAGKAIEGAATGAAVQSVLKPLGKALGVKTSATGAQIGGAVGSFVPGGQIIGSVVGSIVGGLFKTTKRGSATIGNVDGEGVVTGTGGNSSKLRKEASGLADSVLGSLNQIVETLGGELGQFSVSIGKSGDSYHVDTSGRGRLKKSQGGKDFDDDEAAARGYALADAIADGAIQGISSAMQKALQSNSDVDRAVSEALKVQRVEELIGGTGAELEKVFRDFNRNASAYVATARKYGLDVLAVERANAAERAKLIEQTLDDQVGSLRSLLDELKFGGLAEGSPIDQRNALLGQINTVQGRAEAGEAGAADQLAQLYQRLLSSGRENFGTAGPEYAGDRQMAQNNVQKVIALATQRANEAANSTVETLAAISQGNRLADENNALTARLVAGVGSLPDAIASRLAGYGITGAANIQATARRAVA